MSRFGQILYADLDNPLAPVVTRWEPNPDKPSTAANPRVGQTVISDPTGTNVTIWDDGLVKFGRDHHRLIEPEPGRHQYGRGQSDRGSGFIVCRFELLPYAAADPTRYVGASRYYKVIESL